MVGRSLLLSCAVVLVASPAFAAPLTCTYTLQGKSTGADSGNRFNVTPGQWKQVSGQWVYVIPDGKWNDGNDCPKAPPKG